MVEAPAFYARRGGLTADWWTLLHPPYTMWHLSYVVLGAAIAPRRDWAALAVCVAAFFLAVGVAAHALDELQGRPLGTRIDSRTLGLAAGLALAGAVALGLAGLGAREPFNWPLAALIPVGVTLVMSYNLELFGGRLHTDLGFAASWGGFPVVAGFLAQSPQLGATTLVGITAATLFGIVSASAQRRLSTPARNLRRRVADVSGLTTGLDGTTIALDRDQLLHPLEGALRARPGPSPWLRSPSWPRAPRHTTPASMSRRARSAPSSETVASPSAGSVAPPGTSCGP